MTERELFNSAYASVCLAEDLVGKMVDDKGVLKEPISFENVQELARLTDDAKRSAAELKRRLADRFRRDR